MKKINIHILFLLVLMFAGCGKENPFNPEPVDKSEGQISKSAFSLSVLDSSVITNVTNTKSRAEAEKPEISVDDFTISFYQVGISTPKLKFLYKDMPEIITLLHGEYYVVAEYGENVDMGWDKPYYRGESNNFIVKGGEITDDIGVISCKLANVKVSIDFGSVLLNRIENPNVEVKVCESANQEDSRGLIFTDKDVKQCGYFKYKEGVSLVAVFNGTMDGDPSHTVASIPNLTNGKHYKITFKIHVIDEDPGGGIRHNLNIDADLIVRDLERNIDLDEDEILIDDERPREDGNDPKPQHGPDVKAESPINLDIVNIVDKDSHVALNISSKTGLTEFKVNIISNDLKGMVPEVLDLIEPGENLELLKGLGLLPEGKTTVKNDKDVKFDVSGFMEMLCALGSGKEHTFKLTIGDSNGTVVKELQLKTK